MAGAAVAAPPAGTRIGEFVRCISRSTGAGYWFNGRTQQSVWEDASLPVGWAWGKDSATGPTWYINMHSGSRQADRPLAAAAPIVPAASVAAPAAAPHTSAAGLISSSGDGSALALEASRTAGDDLMSEAYIPDEATRGANIPPGVASKRDYFFAAVPPELRWRLHMDAVAMYSVTASNLAEEQSDLIEAHCGGRGVSVTDGTACIGGNVISFARRFARVNAVELSPQRARMLRHNVDVVGVGPRVTVMCGSYLDVFPLLAQDVVFFDPPWGGPEYLAAAQLDMFLGATNIIDVILTLTAPRLVAAGPAGPAGPAAAGAAVLRPPWARWVVLKAPLNYNVPGLRDALTSCGSGARVTLVQPQRKMQLVLIAAGQRPLPSGRIPAVMAAAIARADGAAAAPAPAAAPAAPALAPSSAPAVGFKRRPDGEAAAGNEAPADDGGAAPAAKRPHFPDSTIGSVAAGAPASASNTEAAVGGAGAGGAGVTVASALASVVAPPPGDEPLPVALELLLPIAAGTAGCPSEPAGGSARPGLALIPCAAYVASLPLPASEAAADSGPYGKLADAPAFFVADGDGDADGASGDAPVPLVLTPSPSPHGEAAAAPAATFAAVPVRVHTVAASIASHGCQGMLLLQQLPTGDSGNAWAVLSVRGPDGAALGPSAAAAAAACSKGFEAAAVATWQLQWRPLAIPAGSTAVDAALALAAAAASASRRASAGGWLPAFVAPSPAAAAIGHLLAPSGSSSSSPSGSRAARALSALHLPRLRVTGTAGVGSRGHVFGVTVSNASDDYVLGRSSSSGSGGASGSGSSSGSAVALVAKRQPLDARVRQETAASLVLAASVRASHSDGLCLPLHCCFFANAPGAAAGPSLAAGGAGARAALAAAAAPAPAPSLAVFPHAGRSLEAAVNAGARLQLRPAVALLRRLAQCLQALHASGFLFCDLHADNVMLPLGSSAPAITEEAASKACLIDMGSLQPMQPASSSAAADAVGGAGAGGSAAAASVLSYTGPTRGGRWDCMAPEQFGRESWGAGTVTLTPAADVFAAAAAVLGCMTGVPPFSPANTGSIPFSVSTAAKPKLTIDNTAGHALRRRPDLLADYVRRAAVAAASAGAGAAVSSDAASAAHADAAAAAAAAVLVRALSADPSARYPSAAALGEAADAVLRA